MKEEKREIAALARMLIRMMRECDDADFVDAVARCVSDGEIYPSIDPAYFDSDGWEPLIQILKD